MKKNCFSWDAVVQFIITVFFEYIYCIIIAIFLCLSRVFSFNKLKPCEKKDVFTLIRNARSRVMESFCCKFRLDNNFDFKTNQAHVSCLSGTACSPRRVLLYETAETMREKRDLYILIRNTRTRVELRSSFAASTELLIILILERNLAQQSQKHAYNNTVNRSRTKNISFKSCQCNNCRFTVNIPPFFFVFLVFL